MSLVDQISELARLAVDANPSGLTHAQAFTLLMLAQCDGNDLVRVGRFLAKVTTNDAGCWIWRGATTPGGYGKFAMGAKSQAGNRFPDGAHRASYRLFVGPIPGGLVLDHLCKTPACVHPFHLEAVTQRENLMRGNSPSARYAAQTTCIRGHAKTPENTYYWRGKAAGCRPCQAIRSKSRPKRRKGNRP